MRRVSALLYGLLVALAVSPAFGALGDSLLPADRRTDWSRAGVPGGISHRTKIAATIDARKFGDDKTNAAPAINAAVAACPEEGVVYLPAGVYQLEQPINLGHKSRITLRGAGPGKTVLEPEDSLKAAITTTQCDLSKPIRILSGSEKGSTAITVADATSITPGQLLDIIEENDPDLEWHRGGFSDRMGQFVMVTEVRGNTVHFEDPLVWSFARNPRVRYQVRPGITWTGVEDLTLRAGSSYHGSMIQFWNAYASWVKNVETAWADANDHIYLFGSLRCEVRDSYLHDTYAIKEGHGIQTMMGYYDGTRGGCTGTLIENNIFSNLGDAVVLEAEVGSVIAYNYAVGTRFPGWPDYQVPDFDGNHCPHGMMCLYEGNVGAGGVQQDGYHGSVSHITYFRNAFTGKHVEAYRTGNIKLIDLDRYSYYQNVIGNVLGNPDWPRTTIGRYEMTGMPNYVDQAVIYRLGYPNMGNNFYTEGNPPSNADAGGYDPKVRATLLRWGNFDYQHAATRWEASEIPAGVPVPAMHLLPASLRYPSRPGWWPKAMTWPPIGPDVRPMVGRIPAEVRYAGR